MPGFFNVTRPPWWGGRYHKLYTIIIFVTLASLDNAAIGILPPLYAIIAQGLDVSEAAIGGSTTWRIFVTAISALLWGYWGDRRHRKPLLLRGTLIWSGALFLSGASQTYLQLLLFQTITAIGIGCVASVGFSVINDFIPPAHRGLAMSLWGLAQGTGWGTGAILGSILGAENWRWPFYIISASGVIFAGLYLLTYEPSRGRTEPELAHLFEGGGRYAYRISLADIPALLQQASNRWLILQGLLATIAYGSTLWMPRLFAAKVEAQGYSLEIATIAGALFTLLFQTGGYFSLLAGYLGDRWQQRDRRGRAILSTWGIWGAIPFQIATFLVPLHGLELPAPALFSITDFWGLVNVVGAVFLSLVTNVWVATVFWLALIAVSLSTIDAANRPALLTDVNLPEHRGTIVGLAILANGIGFAVGNGLSGVIVSWLTAHYAPPLNYAIGLSLFQLFLIPAGWCYYRLIQSSPGDIATVRQTLAQRGGIRQTPKPPRLNS